VQDALGSVQSVAIFGATSEIALATLDRLAEGGRLRAVGLAARDVTALAPTEAKLRDRGVSTVVNAAFDATDTGHHEQVVDTLFDALGDVDVAIVAFGVLGDQAEAERDASAAVEVGVVNYLGAVSVGTALAKRMRAQGHGRIVALSSVAGERARRSNFVYGSSKAGMDAFYQGLGDSLVGSGAGVMIVRPGFVHTRMTAGMDPAPLSTTPEAVADAIAKGLAKGSEVVWVPGLLRFVMSGLRHVPRPIFRKLPV
jgi:decaprenylphospho-beta-D-erythro-pentofuranosid-2-ulose 2-reductase